MEGARAEVQVTMSSLVNALELGGQWEEAVVRFDELRERGVLPNAICFNAAISALAKGSEVRPSLPPSLLLCLPLWHTPAPCPALLFVSSARADVG